ncbi:unnamed protein product [Rotaria socialis]|uniref:Pentapeptide repeat-containing protein n=1 Tax=Rotaria socialis TaxID=392032 RepID=A0A821PGC4_9BILA|nr:unnamed protein product [Rotaria socialis]CAF3388511.1 unnamed protein product [Rotaria socialis]CAF3423083.1 unnamed protein product [Rotaria socialis]CAF4209392.1 unnamed protein product [Rotaria socialis]CAF4214660.1 unnamed protein product [Rotaria socialis]
MPITEKDRVWLKLLLSALIPLMIGIFTVVTTIQQQKMSSLQREQDKNDALLLREQSDNQTAHRHKETIYATYLDDVTKLLMSNNETKRLVYIRAKTLIILQQLDSERRKDVLLFLYESELIYHHPLTTITTLLKVNNADFNGIHFERTEKVECTFKFLYLHHVYLSNASFIGCYIDYSNFSHSLMYNTGFSKALLFRTSFRFASLDRANFNQAKLFLTDFSGASLVGCNFRDAYWTNQSVTLTSANLTGAILSNQQLQRSILTNALLPNGTWGPIRRTSLVVNGDAEQDCSLQGSTNFIGWQISVPGIISLLAYNNQNLTDQYGKCYFRVTPSYTLNQAISASQNIFFDEFTLLISANISNYKASVDFRCSGNQYGYMELIFVDLYGLRYFPVSRRTKTGIARELLTISSSIHFEVRSVQLKVSFIRNTTYTNINGSAEENYCIADNIEFFILKRQ